MANKKISQFKTDFLNAIKDGHITLKEAFDLSIELCTIITAFIQAANSNQKVESKPESAEEGGET